MNLRSTHAIILIGIFLIVHVRCDDLDDFVSILMTLVIVFDLYKLNHVLFRMM